MTKGCRFPDCTCENDTEYRLPTGTTYCPQEKAAFELDELEAVESDGRIYARISEREYDRQRQEERRGLDGVVRQALASPKWEGVRRSKWLAKKARNIE